MELIYISVFMLLGYKKDRLQLLAVISIIWFLFGVISLFYSFQQGNSSVIMPVLYIAQAVLFFGIYHYCKTKKYIVICKDYIQCNSLAKPKANIKDILKVRKTGNVYFLYTSKRTLRINSKLLDQKATQRLEEFLKQLPNAVIV